jgi:hypothetical protein
MVARVLFPCSHVEERDQQSTSIPNKHISIPILVSEQSLLPAPGLSRRRFRELDAPISQLLICLSYTLRLTDVPNTPPLPLHSVPHPVKQQQHSRHLDEYHPLDQS